MDGLPALDLWDVVIEVLHSSNNRRSSTKRAADTACTCLVRSWQRKVTRMLISCQIQIRCPQTQVLLNAKRSCTFWRQRGSDQDDHQRKESDDETRSKNHRVAPDWLCDRINFDPKIQIEHDDTQNQLADILTQGNFPRDEWNRLLHLFNISNFSSASCFQIMANQRKFDTWRMV